MHDVGEQSVIRYGINILGNRARLWLCPLLAYSRIRLNGSSLVRFWKTVIVLGTEEKNIFAKWTYMRLGGTDDALWSSREK